MSTANELLAAACTSGISCLDEMNLLRVIAQGTNAGGGGGGGGGGTLSTDGTFAANSDLLYPSQKAAKTYIDTGLAGKQNSLGFTPENVANKSTDGTFAANSDTLYPSQKAAKTYVDNAITVTAAGLYVLKAGDTMTGALIHPAGAVGAPSVSVGGVASGLWSPAANTVSVATAGAERLRIIATGEVGIGTTPTAKLHISATASAGIQALLVNSSGTLADNDFIRFQIAGLTNGFRMRQNASSAVVYSFEDGNVGIGTSTPVDKLEIQDVDKAVLTLYDDANLRIVTTDALAINKGGAISLGGVANISDNGQFGFAAVKGAKENGTDGDISGYLSLLTSRSGIGTQEWMRITSTGNVGIGETSPGSKLSVSGGGSFGVGYDTTTAPTNGLIIEGNVGIGTTAPNEILSINGARAALYNTLTSATNFERLDFEWSANVARIWTEKGSGGGTARDLVLGADATELLRFQTGSKLGFFGVTPVVRPPAYTPSNVTTDRSYDANASTLDEIADVLGTLIADLQGLGLLQ